MAADNNLAGEVYPDQSLYPANSMPEMVRRINRALMRADQIHHSEGRNGIHWFAPLVADAEAGFGGVLNAFELTKQLIDSLVAGGAVDTDRIYITGLSMGGYGTWEAIQRWPDFFAAAIPICGGGDPALANTLTTLPLWAWHGEVDTVIEVNKTRRMIDAINAAGGHPKATYIAKCGHGSWGPAYKEAALSTWLLAQRRPSKPSGK